MARRLVTMKLDVDDVVRWDEFARGRGWSRTGLVEFAVERLLVAEQDGMVTSAAASVRVRAAEEGVPEPKKLAGWYRPRSGEAKAGVRVDERLLEFAKRRSVK